MQDVLSYVQGMGNQGTTSAKPSPRCDEDPVQLARVVQPPPHASSLKKD